MTSSNSRCDNRNPAKMGQRFAQDDSVPDVMQELAYSSAQDPTVHVCKGNYYYCYSLLLLLLLIITIATITIPTIPTIGSKPPCCKPSALQLRLQQPYGERSPEGEGRTDLAFLGCKGL